MIAGIVLRYHDIMFSSKFTKTVLFLLGIGVWIGAGVVWLRWPVFWKARMILRGDAGGSYVTTFSPDGQILASWGRSGVNIWNVETGVERSSFPVIQDTLPALRFMPDGKTLAVAGREGAADGISFVSFWDVARGGEKLTRKIASTGSAGNHSFSPDGRVCASLNRDQRQLKLWDSATGKEIATLVHRSYVRSWAFSPQSEVLVVRFTNNVVVSTSFW